MKKLPAKSAFWVLPLILSGLMTFLVSLINIIKAVGFTDGFWHIWLQGWAVSWVIAYPVLLAVLPVVQRIMKRIVEAPAPQQNGTNRT